MGFKTFSTISLLSALLPLTTQARTSCPLLGPDFPEPKNLSSQPSIQAAVNNLTSVLQQIISTGNSSYGLFDSQNTSFALEIYSTNEPEPLFSQYYTAPSVASDQYGVKSIDTNTIFRIGSLTKLLTIYTFLIQDGDIKFNEPITKYVPELAAASQTYNATANPIDYVDWDDITIGELASQSAGIGRDYSGVGQIGGPFFSPDPNTSGLPPLNASEQPVCMGGADCTRAKFFKGFTQIHPVYAPSHSGAIYSNFAYLILAYALENITNTPFPTLVQNSIYDPLNLTHSSWSNPPQNSNTSAIIPANYLSFSINVGDETAVGGSWSSPADLTKIGRSILSSSLLKLSLTRRWMKPRIFVSDPSTAVGAPWEIHRLQLPSSLENGRIVDLYCKAGDFAGYSSVMILAPDWNVGVTLLAAGETTTFNLALLGGVVSDVFLPSIEAAAREEADAIFAGTYAYSSNNSDTSTLNSSITLTTSSSSPGLIISSWISNGTNFLNASASVIADPDIRLYPSGLNIKQSDGCTIMGFRSVSEDLSAQSIGGLFGTGCETWATVDGANWGIVGSDEFLITVGPDGIAKKVEPRVLRVELERVG
ncbi:hypothetical protein G7Y89_g82 [Cudoniella acicularis]|uniref:Beta-lactamase-related domain-containing protein n=1 Tax=Cudoniella acicularis TaxID=354080 RepID=A0A8H4RZV3_9HELO|nr:hypothetical protein G7Y89_g82 [Cudoniella acicularis]